MAVRGFIENGVNPAGGVAAVQLEGYPSDATKFLNGAGGWSVPGGSGGGAELTYDQYTAPVTISATTEATANTVVTSTAHTYDGATAVFIEFWAPYMSNGASGSMTLVLYEDGASIGFLGAFSVGGSTSQGPNARLRRTPASGSRTYSVRAFRATANGTVGAGAGGAGAYPPGFIRAVTV